MLSAPPGVVPLHFSFDRASDFPTLPYAGTVHLWFAGIDGHFPANQFLSVQERTRAARFRFEHERRRFLASRVFMRCVLAGYLGTAPDALALRVAPGGKPECDGLSFNLSRSERYAVLSVAADGRIGVDIERCVPIEDVWDVARFFPREGMAIAALLPDWQADGFFGVWTAKEAFLKAVGTGLIEKLDSLEVTVDPRLPPRLLSIAAQYGRAEHWRLLRFRIGTDYLGTIAHEIRSA